jgi:AraC family transcriptional regulator
MCVDWDAVHRKASDLDAHAVDGDPSCPAAPNAAAAGAHDRHFLKVLAHIDAHAEDELTVEELSRVAGLSKYHFHRLFSQRFGISVGKFVQLVRMRRASYQLAFRSQDILDVALDSGYESHEAFSRAFKKLFGQSPSSFREQPAWERWLSTQEPLSTARVRPSSAVAVEIVVFPETRVAVLEHRGAPDLLGESIRRFIEWRKRNKLSPRTSATFNIVYDDPEGTPPEEYRFDLCAAIRTPVAENASGVIEKVIPGGRCAFVRHVGTEEALFQAVAYLYATWLPASGEEPRDFPLFLRRVQLFPDVPEHEAVTEIFLPLR